MDPKRGSAGQFIFRLKSQAGADQPNNPVTGSGLSGPCRSPNYSPNFKDFVVIDLRLKRCVGKCKAGGHIAYLSHFRGCSAEE